MLWIPQFLLMPALPPISAALLVSILVYVAQKAEGCAVTWSFNTFTIISIFLLQKMLSSLSCPPSILLSLWQDLFHDFPLMTSALFCACYKLAEHEAAPAQSVCSCTSCVWNANTDSINLTLQGPSLFCTSWSAKHIQFLCLSKEFFWTRPDSKLHLKKNITKSKLNNSSKCGVV